jgi:hypothetical protein
MAGGAEYSFFTVIQLVCWLVLKSLLTKTQQEMQPERHTPGDGKILKRGEAEVKKGGRPERIMAGMSLVVW